MYFLWIDPWFKKLWYSLIDERNNIIDAGVIIFDNKDKSEKFLYDRVKQVYWFFNDILGNYALDWVWIEKYFVSKLNYSNVEFFYTLRWCIMLIFMWKNIVPIEYSPKYIKKFISWNWNSSKSNVDLFISKIFNIEKINSYSDISDSLAIAYITKTKIIQKLN